MWSVIWWMEEKHKAQSRWCSLYLFFVIVLLLARSINILQREREHQFGYLQDIINDVQLTMSACVRSAGGEGGGGGRRDYSHFTVHVRGHSPATLHPETKRNHCEG